MKLGIVASAVVSLAAICPAQDQASPSQAVSRTDAPVALVARLNKKLSTKTLKAGGKVTATVIQDVVVAGKVFIPRETKLTGRVVEVQTPTKTDPRSRLVLIFESRTLPGRGTLPMRGLIQALAAPLQDPFLESAMASSSPYGAGEYGHPVNGGILSTGQSNAPTEVTAAQPRQTGARALEQRQRALENADKPGGPGTGPHGAVTVVSRGVFGLPGIFLAGSATVPVIVASGKNVELQSGTQIVLRLE
jgi:hypothetical protein